MKPLQVLQPEGSWTETNRLLSGFVQDYFKRPNGKETIEILEAGCGQQWNLKLDINYKLTGCDLSREAMEIRRERYQDLDEFIVGDLATVAIENNSFDVVYSSYVLEHVEGAEEVLKRFFNWVTPGGLVVLVFPDRDSVFGFITRLTPHWFHVFYYKYILKFPNAGMPGHNPFPTAYEPVTARRGMHKFCREQGYKIRMEFASALDLPNTNGAVALLITATVKIVAALSFGKLSANHQNMAMILEKPETQ